MLELLLPLVLFAFVLIDLSGKYRGNANFSFVFSGMWFIGAAYYGAFGVNTSASIAAIIWTFLGIWHLIVALAIVGANAKKSAEGKEKKE